MADIQTQAVLFAAQYRPLRYGSTGEDVKELQVRLMALGYYKGKTSGNYLEGTRSAVRRFQEANHMEADGEADPETQAMIYSPEAVGRHDAEPTGTPSPESRDYLVDEERENPAVEMPDGQVEFTKQLKNGSEGKLVKTLQQRLTALGYYRAHQRQLYEENHPGGEEAAEAERHETVRRGGRGNLEYHFQ